MSGKEELEVEFDMCQRAIEDLESKGGDKEAIKALKEKAGRIGQALNATRAVKERRKGLFSDVGRKSPR